MIGNYGVNTEDPESARPQVAGVVVRELSRTYSNWRATGSLQDWLGEADVPILHGSRYPPSHACTCARRA